MKNAFLILLSLCIIVPSFSLSITLLDGRKFGGELQSAADQLIVLNDASVIISIPASQVQLIMDGKTDRTKEILSKATLKPTKPKIDEHYIQEDDYFVFDEAFDKQTYIFVHLAKMLTPPTSETKNQAQFLIVNGGQKDWKKYWVTTTKAKKESLKPGNAVIVFDMWSEGDIYRAPESNQEARSNNWFMATITDTSELFKGYVIVSGGYKISIDNIRVIDK